MIIPNVELAKQMLPLVLKLVNPSVKLVTLMETVCLVLTGFSWKISCVHNVTILDVQNVQELLSHVT